MNRPFVQFLQVLFILLDLLALNLVFLLAQEFFHESAESRYFFRYTQFWIIMNGMWLFAAGLGGVYSLKNISYFDNFTKRTARFYALWALLNLLYLFLPRRVELSKSLVLTTIAAFCFVLILNRLLYIIIRQWVKQKALWERKILIIGYNELAKKLATYLEKEALDSSIVGFIDDKKTTAEPNVKYPLYTNLAETLAISNRHRVNELYSTIMPENNHVVYNIMQKADKELIRFKLVPDFSYLVNRPVHQDYLNDLLILTVRNEPLQDLVNRVVKRGFDICMSTFVILFILSWLIPLLGLLIKLESRGPILFAQLRSGKNNRPFRCYKFRSMGANKEANSIQATKNDKRVTRIGRIIRKTSVDELPQFLNVFKGEMSVVGPRPHMLKHTKSFSNLDEDYMIRQFLKPGITGWAQVNGYRGEITELQHIKKRVEYDLQYMENWTFWLDLRIIFLTVYNVFRGEKNAY